MPIPALLCITLLAGLLWNVARKYYTDRTSSELSLSFIYNFVGCLVGTAVLLLMGGFGTASGYTLWMGLAFGGLTALQMIASIIAFRIGPMSYTSVFISFSTLISALSGVAFFGESLGWTQYVGIPLMLVSFVLAVDKQGEDKGFSFTWLLLSLLSFFTTGGIGIMQKVHGSSVYKEEINAFLVIAFATSAVVCGLVSLLLYFKEKKAGATYNCRALPFLIGTMVVGGASIAVANKLNLYLAGAMESAVFFPLVNGGGLVLTTLSALLLFRERLTKKKWVGLFLGIASVVCLCLPSA